MKDFVIMASSPYFGGPLTVPYRIVLLRWVNGDYSVHTQEYGTDHVSNGSYFGKAKGRAADWWVTVVYNRIVLYDEPLMENLPASEARRSE